MDGSRWFNPFLEDTTFLGGGGGCWDSYFEDDNGFTGHISGKLDTPGTSWNHTGWVFYTELIVSFGGCFFSDPS